MNSPIGILIIAAMLTFANRLPAAEGPASDLRGLQRVVDSAVSETLKEFTTNQLQSNQLAVTLVDLRAPAKPAQASYRGDVAIYPASVVKLFYLVAAHQWMEEGKLEDTPELRRAMRDMIVESYNEATHYIVDLLTGTTSGPELPEREIDEWFEKRNAVNRYFVSLGYTNINANKKPWCEGPYGRESQSIKRHKPNRNMLTTDATARLLTERPAWVRSWRDSFWLKNSINCQAASGCPEPTQMPHASRGLRTKEPAAPSGWGATFQFKPS